MARSMDSASVTPSSSMRIASRPSITPSRLVAKPGESRTTTSDLPSRRTHSRALSRTSSRVLGPSTISTSLDTGTGLKKCMPTNRPGCTSTAPSSATDSELVLVATTVSLDTASSTAVSTRTFSSGASGTASTTRSAFFGSAGISATKSIRASTCVGVPSSLPRSAARRRPVSTRVKAALAAMVSLSPTVTSAPIVANTWAIPAPIRPPPTTATRTSDPFHEHCHALTDPDAQRSQAAPTLLALQPPQQGDDQPCARAAQRMTQRDRAAVGVDLLLVQLQPADHCQALHRERLVQL